MLECTSVSDLLLNFDHAVWSNLNTLLYNLQVVEVLIQPAVSASDLADQQRFIKDIDHALLQTWVQRFLQKGGLCALCKAFEWIQRATHAYLCANPAPVGVTAQRLHGAAALISKLLRAFFLRGCAQMSAAQSTAIEDAIQGSKPVEAKGDVESATPSAPDDVRPRMVGCNDARNGASVTATAATSGAEETAPTGLSAEWGWCIDLASSENPSAWVAQIDISHMRDTLLSALVCLRKLSVDAFFHAGILADNATRTAKSNLRDALVSSLDNLLVVWMTMATLGAAEDGAVTTHSQRIVDELLLGQVPGAVASSAPSEGRHRVGGACSWDESVVAAQGQCHDG